MTTRQEMMEKVSALQEVCRRWERNGWNLEDANERGKESLPEEQRQSYEDEIRPLLIEILEKELLKFTVTIPICKRKEQAKLSEEGVYYVRTRDLRKMYYVPLKDFRHKLEEKGNLLAYAIYPDTREMTINWDMWKQSNKQGNNWILRMWNGKPEWHHHLDLYCAYQKEVEKGIQELEEDVKPYIAKRSDKRKGKFLYTSIRTIDRSGNPHLLYWKYVKWYWSRKSREPHYVSLEVFRILLLQLGEPAAYYIFPEKETLYIDIRHYLEKYGYVRDKTLNPTRFTIPIDMLPDWS